MSERDRGDRRHGRSDLSVHPAARPQRRRAVFDAFVATIDLTPETAVDFPNLTTTFVSPTYGYSFGYLDRGGLAPATKLWDPVNQQPISNPDNPHERFDAVETGLGDYFQERVDRDPGRGLDR